MKERKRSIEKNINKSRRENVKNVRTAVELKRFQTESAQSDANLTISEQTCSYLLR